MRAKRQRTMAGSSSSSSKGEALTIQIGQYANFVGTHLWNVNEDVLHSAEEASFRPSRFYHESATGTLAPRCIMMDLNENIGNLYKPDYESLDNYGNIWSGNIQNMVRSSFAPQSMGGPSASSNSITSIVGNNNWSDMLKFKPHR